MKLNLNSVQPYTTLNSVQSYTTLCTATCVHFSVQQHNNLYVIIQQFLCVKICTKIYL